MKTYITLIILIACLPGIAQTTAIPDSNFEQALIDLGIDSDGTINGQVLTADIMNVALLNIPPFYGIQDLTGIEDFSVLEELYCSNPAGDVSPIQIDTLDLSNNPNIHTIEVRNLAVYRVVNLKNGNNINMDPFFLDIYWEGGAFTPANICIQVDDENAAQQNQYPYSAWVINDGPNINYSYSEDCSLGIATVQQQNIQVFPNPVRDFLTIRTPVVKLQKIELYSLQGKLIKSLSANLERINMRDMASGVYFVKLYSNSGVSVRKIVKR